ncbi:adenosylcobyric acid synthase (glutamine-hydrolysing) [Breoghania corrubedonensis]|uniref:Cobyric acid synthase n=1 Tax=Breoghania corrubedonensis TaxID=665038 RepID=A0A2T5V9G3_9HYPH|nr:cobyric acid synthase [Breoghania corrubedonensis]PTW60387.1 adenosylcobyric acid synthase (glutamine-hydrolysing) [Breoghania corrubedonensis]
MTRTPALMIQGTGSNVGKSLIVAGLARALTRRGLKVMPFKPQNMSNNAAVTADGGEIGRAQALQAKAARVPATVHMNPVLLKPETDTGAQVIVQGVRVATLRARDYGRQKSELLAKVLESFAVIEADADIVLVEGAGSPAETNLRAGDIANMGFAEAADVPVILVGDIDRGGVIASLVGTHCVLDEAECSRVKGFMINRFRGDVSLFCEGEAEIARRTGWRALGTVPWFDQAADLPAEDVLGLAEGPAPDEAVRAVKIAVPIMGRIANFDDLDPLRMEPGVDLRLVRAGEPLPGDADLVLLPGSKSTIADLAFLRAQGWDIDLAAHRRRGGAVLGLCGGYQMLGRTIADPLGLEGGPGTVEGLGLLDVETRLGGDKTLTLAEGRHMPTGAAVSGYEIHLGQTQGADCERPFVEIGGRMDGAMSSDALVMGTYLHGLFGSDDFRSSFLEALGGMSGLGYENRVESALEALADHLEKAVDLDALLALARAR